ncbi:MAG: hypothetical protein KF866_07160 [Phycisphaeraceae bacterium]|nr:hypothetical protein [Phycisphaeraceae bacterium]
MQTAHRLIRSAARRLTANLALRNLTLSLTAGLAALTALVLCARVFGFSVNWPLAAALAFGGVLLGMIVWTWLARPRSAAVARILDHRAQLRESLSTALTVEGQTDPWSLAVLETTERAAIQVQLKRVVPIETPRAWPYPAYAALALALAWIAMPELDLFGRDREQQASREQQNELRLARQDFQATQQQLDDLLRQAGLEALEPPEDSELSRAKSPEDIRQAMVKQLTAAAQRLEDQRKSLAPEHQRALSDALKQLRRPGDGPLSEVSRHLARGDLAGAQDALRAMAERMSELSPEERQTLEEQARQLAQQLDDIAQQQEAAAGSLASALENAGMTAEEARQVAEALAQQAGDLESMNQGLENAMQQLANLTPQQREELTRLAAQLASSADLKQLQECMQNMGECQGDEQSMTDALAMMSQMLQEMGMQQAECKAGDQAAEQGLARLHMMLAQTQGAGQGPSMLPDRGGHQAGFGGTPEIGATPRDTTEQFTIRKERSIGEQPDGPIIASTLVDGPQIIGESRAEFVQAVEAAEQVASEAIDSQQIPRDRQELVKRYFGNLKRNSEDKP